MPSDPGFSADTCIFMEAAPGDGGDHNGNGVWWLSKDLSLTGPISGIDQADPGQANSISVKFRRKPDTSGCTFPGAESITVEAWVANPSLVMAPNGPASRRVGFIGSPLPAAGGSATQPIDWTPSTGLPAADPESGGQKCLIARAYPDNLTPSALKFFVPDDQHVVQHNLCVVSCPIAQQPCKFTIGTMNPSVKFRLKVKLRAEFDANPNDFVSRAVLRRLHSTSGFQDLATTPPPSFGFEFDGPPISIGSLSQPTGPTTNTPTSTETFVSIGSQRLNFRLAAKLPPTPGLAYIFHVTQTTTTNLPQGGLTVVMLAV